MIKTTHKIDGGILLGKQIFENSLNKVQSWVEKHKYKGYEPSDGLSSFLRPLAFNNLLLQRLLSQLIWKFPINIRPLLGVPFQESTKGRGYMVRGYLERFKYTGKSIYLEKATESLKWLIENKSPGYGYYCWGNHFEFATRGGYSPKYAPTIVWTSHIGQAFLDAYNLTKNDDYLEIANNICEWIISLPREKTEHGTCLSYVVNKQMSIHNSNMLGAALLARMAKINNNDQYKQLADEAMKYSCSRQLSNGAWYYGEAQTYHWIDNFHTGYNLDSLKLYIQYTKNDTYIENLNRGFTYFKKTFFKKDGTPRYYHNSTFPLDIQCASQAIETLTYFSDQDDEALDLAIKVATWTINNMQDRDGHFYYRILPFGIVNKAAMMHWGQATMFRALSLLITTLDKKESAVTEKKAV